MSNVHNEERHPNGTPKTIHHYDKEGKPVYHHEVEAMDVDDLVALGHSRKEAEAMNAEAGGKGKGKKKDADE